jgi:hypothetical protein
MQQAARAAGRRMGPAAGFCNPTGQVTLSEPEWPYNASITPYAMFWSRAKRMRLDLRSPVYRTKKAISDPPFPTLLQMEVGPMAAGRYSPCRPHTQ